MTLQLLTLPEYQFLRWAFLLSAMASLSFGLIGSFVVVRRIGYLAGAISHCAFGGIGIGIWIQQAIAGGGLGISLFLTASGENRAEQLKTAAGYADPTLIATFFAILAAFLIGFLQKHAKEREDSIIGMIWATGMATGLLFLDRTTGYVSISGYLFGDIVLISASDLLTVGILGSCVLLVSLIFFHRLEAVCFDEEFARLRGIHVDFYFQMLLILIAATVVLMLRIVGMLLVIALLTIPAATAAQLTRRLAPMILLSVLFCFIGSWLGILFSVVLNFSTGPVIIMVISVMYASTLLLRRLAR